MAGNCAIFRSWETGNLLTASDLTMSFTQVGVTNMTPSCMDDYSVDTNQFRSTVDPYPGSVASLPTSLAGELERIRYILKTITGWTQWYTHTEGGGSALWVATTGDTMTGALTINMAAATGYAMFQNSGTEIGRFLSSGTSMIVRPGALGDLIFQNQGGTELVRMANGGLVTITTALALGATPAASGSARFSNNTAVAWRNAANTADVTLKVNASDNFEFDNHLKPAGDNGFDIGGAGTQRWRTIFLGTSVEVGTNPASAGAVRLANNQGVIWRNSANSGNVTFKVNASDNFEFDAHLKPSSDNAVDFGGGGIQRFRDAFFGTSVQIGTNPASAGLLRLGNAGYIKGRNAGNTADRNMIAVDSSDRIELGEDSVVTRSRGKLRCDIDANARFVLPVGTDKWAT